MSFADRREAVAAMIANALRKAGVERLEFEVRPLVQDEQAGIGIADEARTGDDDIVADLQLLGDEFAQRRRTGGVDLHADHHAAPPPLQRGLEQPDQVLGLFLDLDIAVANDAEQPLAKQLVTREQPRDEQGQKLLERQETGAGADRRQPHETFELVRDRQSAFIRSPSLRRFSSAARKKPRFGMNGKGCAGSMAMGVTTGRI